MKILNFPNSAVRKKSSNPAGLLLYISVLIILLILEGEGDWGEVIGIVWKDNKIIYIGTDYLNPESWC